jgi:hypothetical protein
MVDQAKAKQSSDDGQQPSQQDASATQQVADLMRSLATGGDGGDADRADDGDDQEQAGAAQGAQSDGDNDLSGAEDIDTSDLGIGAAENSGDADSTSALAELAEKAGTSVEELYKLEIAMPDGRPTVTLGELKDSHLDAQALDDQRASFDEHRTSFENEMIRARGELTEVLSLLGELPDELLQRGRQQYAKTVDEERSALLGIKPEWADIDAYRAAKGQMAQAVSEYGFRPAELEAIVDHRLVKLVWDFSELKRRVDAAKAGRKRQVRDHKTSRPANRAASGNATRTEQQQRAAASSRSEDKAAAIAGILTDSLE